MLTAISELFPAIGLPGLEKVPINGKFANGKEFAFLMNIMKRLFESLLDARARQTIKQRDL